MPKHSEETKQKIRAALLGRKLSEETKQKMSEKKQGENHPFYGRTHSEETKTQWSIVRTGKKHSEESKARISKSIQKRWDDAKSKEEDSNNEE